MMFYDTVVNGTWENTIGEWKKVQSIDGLKDTRRLKMDFYSVI